MGRQLAQDQARAQQDAKDRAATMEQTMGNVFDRLHPSEAAGRPTPAHNQSGDWGPAEPLVTERSATEETTAAYDNHPETGQFAQDQLTALQVARTEATPKCHRWAMSTIVRVLMKRAAYWLSPGNSRGKGRCCPTHPRLPHSCHPKNPWATTWRHSSRDTARSSPTRLLAWRAPTNTKNTILTLRERSTPGAITNFGVPR